MHETQKTKRLANLVFDLWSVHTDVTDHTASTDAPEVRIYSTDATKNNSLNDVIPPSGDAELARGVRFATRMLTASTVRPYQPTDINEWDYDVIGPALIT